MKINRKHALVLFMVLGASMHLLAQDKQLTKKYKSAIIDKVSTELTNRYVYPEKAENIARNLHSLNESGYFKKSNSLEDFSAALTEAIYETGKDKHIMVEPRPKPEEQVSEDPMKAWYNSRLEERSFYRRYNANFKNVNKLEGNIGYLDLRGFYGLDFGRSFAQSVMAMLATSDAIIIDLRNNSGGRGDMVNYLLSYFFDQPVITGVSKKRRGDEFVERVGKTNLQKDGKVMPDIPLFILTSKNTFSAAEAFTYPLKVYKRATIVGETTKGGANAGDIIALDDQLQIFIPDVAGLPHPVSGEVFEGKGIEPDISASSSEAYDVTLEEARDAANAYRDRLDQDARNQLVKLSEAVESYDGSDDQKIVECYLACKSNDLIFEEWELNALGYQLLQQDAKETARAVLLANTVLYPHSANALDSYAEALQRNGQLEMAVEYYQKAVYIASENEDEELELYRKNLNSAMALLEEKKK